MTNPIRDRYDSTPYQDFRFREFDLARLMGLTRVLGLATPPTDQLRILDIGCASGLHIREQSALYPSARFTGVDFSSKEIEAGQAAILESGLTGVELIHADLSEFEIEEGAFDVILCHGIFSWVPDETKGRIFDLCRVGLKPQGLAAVAYLTYPGWKQREALRELLAMRVSPIEDPREQVRESARLLKLLELAYSANPKLDHATGLLQIIQDMQSSSANVFIHDELGLHHDPCYFLQFVEWAAEHDLRYLAETDLGSMSSDLLPDEARPVLDELDLDFLETQQLLDFVVNRSGRSSILTKSSVALGEALSDQAFTGVKLTVPLSGPAPALGTAEEPIRFASIHGHEVEIDGTDAKQILSCLFDSAPRAMSVEEIEAGVSGFSGRSDALLPVIRDLVRRGVLDSVLPL